MSDDLEKFVLRYEVDSNDAVARLKKLEQQVAKTNKGIGSDAAKELKSFARSASSELGKVSSVLGEVTEAVGALGAGFGAAAVGAAALAVAMKAAMATREQMNRLRVDARESGVSGLQLASMQRNLVGGNVTRENVSGFTRGTQNALRAAVTNPTGKEALLLSQMGVRPVGANGKFTSTMDAMKQMADFFHGHTVAQTSGMAATLGLNPDVALAMRSQGAAFAQTKMSAKDVQNQMDAIDNTSKFNTELAEMDNQIQKLTVSVGGFVLGPLTKFLEKVNGVVGVLGKGDTKTHAAGEGNIPVFEGDWTGGEGVAAALRGDKPKAAKAEETAAERAAREAKETAAKNAAAAADHKRAQELIDKTADSDNQQQQDLMTQFALAIGAFGGSVNTFSGVLDDKAAWAAWAGTVGRAGGLSGANRSEPALIDSTAGHVSVNQGAVTAAMGGGTGVASQYDSIINAAAAKHGVSADIIRGIIGAESTFNPNAHSASSYGLAGINKVNWAAYGMDESNWRDPAKNIDTGAAIYAAMLKKAGGDQTLALRYYNGGFDQSKWGPQNAAYPGKVLGGIAMPGRLANAYDPKAVGPYSFTGGAAHPGIGSGPMSRENYRFIEFAGAVARNIGVPVAQLLQGGVSKGDIQFGESQMIASLMNDRTALALKAKGPIINPAQLRELQTATRSNQLAFDTASMYGADLIGRGYAGDRERTQGIPANVTFNINGVQDPAAVARAVDARLSEMIGSVANSKASAIVR